MKNWLDKYEQGGLVLNQKTNDNYGVKDNPSDSSVSLPQGFVGMGNDITGRRYSPAWGGQFELGGSIPGSVGFTYARTINPAPSEGKYAKKTMPSAENGITEQPKIIQNFNQYSKSPEGEEYFKMMHDNQRAKQISGRIDYSEIDPITDILLGAGIGKVIGQKLGNVIGNTVSKNIKKNIFRKTVSNPSRTIKNSPDFVTPDDIDKLVNREKDWLNSNYYATRKQEATGMSLEAIQKDKEKILSKLDNVKIEYLNKPPAGAAGTYSKRNNSVQIYQSTKPHMWKTLDHEIKHAGSEEAINTGDPLINLIAGTDKYKNYPSIDVGKWYDNLVPGQNIRQWANEPAEQQVVAKRIMDYIEQTQGIKRGEPIEWSNLRTFADDLNVQRRNKDQNNSDIMYVMTELKNKFGPDYLNNVKDLVNKAYMIPAAGVVVAGTSDQFENGGEIPTAENGQEMKFYQEGLDWKPKTISKNGGWLEKYDEGGDILPLEEESDLPSKEERLRRQAYAESTWQDGDISSRVGALGPLQILPDAYTDYAKGTGDKTPYKSVKQFPQAIKVRNWLMDNIANAEFIKDKPQTEEVKLAKIYAAYNYGKKNVADYLNDAKSKGTDIYNNLDWLKGLPKETKDYIGKILLKNNPKFESEFKDANIHNPNRKFFPKHKDGGELTKLDQLTNFSGYDKSIRGGWLNKYS